MDDLDGKDDRKPVSVAQTSRATLPVGLVPTPSREYNKSFARQQALRQPIRPALPLVRSADAELGEGEQTAVSPAKPVLFGSRALIYKQDPSVAELGIRKVLLRGPMRPGPHNARIRLQGVASVAPNTMNDFIQTPDTEGFDAVHTFAVVHQALTKCQRALGSTIRWQWNSRTDQEPINVSPRAGETMNAFYSRTDKSLEFFFFRQPGAPASAPFVFTCRSFDIVAHETGHAVLDSLKPRWIEAGSPNPETGALHEAFGDILAIFLALAQLDQVEALIVQTKGDLHNKTFLSDMAEQFGLALGRDNGLRNADNDKRMSEVSNEVHDLSQVFTGGIYDVLADMFEFERDIAREDEASTLLRVADYLFGLLLRAIVQAPDADATFADVVNQMLSLSAADGKPVEHRDSIRNQFVRREVVTSPVPLTKSFGGEKLAAQAHPHLVLKEDGLQNRSACCGTMRLREYSAVDAAYEAELEALRNGGLGGSDEKNGSGKKKHQKVAAE